jgi:1,4-dihydroxy-2-naphthoyl-CoA hydrolase
MMEFPVKRTLLDSLGIQLVQMDLDRVVATMPVDERTYQPFGLLHGGASVALAETVASIGTGLNIDTEKQFAVGLEINANHLRSKSDGIVTAVATPVFKGRTTMVWDIRITDEQEKLICISRCTVAIRDRA